MVESLSVLSPDPEAGYPPIHPRNDIPSAVRCANSRTAPLPKGSLGLPRGEIVAHGRWNDIAG